MSEESQNQSPDHNESSGTLVQQCPLEPSTFLETLQSSGMRILEEIEKHVSTSKCHHPPLKDLILHGSLDGTTPLLLACYFGDLKCVKHIVENWGVDLQAAAVYYHQDRFCTQSCRIQSAFPVFVAAYHGHLDIVKYLVGLGADVSSKTSSEEHCHLNGLTPLHVAVRCSHVAVRCSHVATYCSHSETLALTRFLLESGADPSVLLFPESPIWMSSSDRCIDTNTALIQHGLDLNQRNEKGETILHHWAYHSRFDDPKNTTSIRDALAFVELLVNSGADLMARDKSGFTPLLRAASECTYPVVDFLMTRDYADRMEIIDGMELAAAEILWKSSFRLKSEQERAFEYLRKALDLRQIESLHMTPLKLKSGRIIGWTTAAQLDQVIEQPAEYILQFYLIQLRICSGRCWEAVSSLCGMLFDSISCLKKRNPRQNHFVDLLDLLWATFEAIPFHLPHHNYGLWKMADDVVENLFWMISRLGKDDPLYNADTFKTILKVVLVRDQAWSGPGKPRCWSLMYNLIKILTSLAGLPDLPLHDTNKIPIGSGQQA